MSTNWGRVAPHLSLCVAVTVAAPVASRVAGLDVRLVGMITGSLGLCLLMFRLFETWKLTGLLIKVLTVALIGSLLLTVVGQFQLRHNVALVTVVSYPLIGHRVGCLMIGLYWRWLLCVEDAETRHRLV